MVPDFIAKNEVAEQTDIRVGEVERLMQDDV
jgi:hypothetical protein